MTNNGQRESLMHRVFALSIWIKAIDGILEIIGGAVLLLAGNQRLNQTIVALTQHELIEDPHDLLATAARRAVEQMSANTTLFASLYLIAHGLVKIVLVVGLLRRQRWAYPAAIGFLCLFITYQLYRMTYQFSVGLALLTVFDIVIVGLIWREYRAQRRGFSPA